MSFSRNQYPQKCLISRLPIELQGTKTWNYPEMNYFKNVFVYHSKQNLLFFQCCIA